MHRILLPLFSVGHHTNYVNQVTRLLLEVNVSCSKKVAARLIYSRFCNPHGGPNNLPLDLKCEFENRSPKLAISELGDNGADPILAARAVAKARFLHEVIEGNSHAIGAHIEAGKRKRRAAAKIIDKVPSLLLPYIDSEEIIAAINPAWRPRPATFLNGADLSEKSCTRIHQGIEQTVNSLGSQCCNLGKVYCYCTFCSWLYYYY